MPVPGSQCSAIDDVAVGNAGIAQTGLGRTKANGSIFLLPG